MSGHLQWQDSSNVKPPGDCIAVMRGTLDIWSITFSAVIGCGPHSRIPAAAIGQTCIVVWRPLLLQLGKSPCQGAVWFLLPILQLHVEVR